jgi:hypothetical protein
MKKIGEATILNVADIIPIRLAYWSFRNCTNRIKQTSLFHIYHYCISNDPLNFVIPIRSALNRTPGISLYYLKYRISIGISSPFLLNPYSLPRA